MRESIGKQTERDIFFKECLPSWFSRDQLVAGNYLTLLGDIPRELEYTDALGIPRSHVWSVEERLSVFRVQEAGNWGTSLYYGPVAEYLEHLLHHDKAFLALRLDVEGSYLIQLDRAMTSVLLFCRRNPATVVGTYSSIGRDKSTIYEGVKSLAWFLALAPDPTKELLATLMERYRKGNFDFPMRMALRDLFWLRSNLEHAIIVSVAVGATKVFPAKAVLDDAVKVWQGICRSHTLPLTLGKLEEMARRHEIANLPVAGIVMEDGRHIVYRAKHPWSQRCYFTKWVPTASAITAGEWVASACRMMRESPLIYIDRTGERRSFEGGAVRPSLNPIVWRSKDVYSYVPRVLPLRSFSQHLAMSQTVREIKSTAKAPIQNKNGSAHIPTTEEEENMAQYNGKFTEGGKLTDYGKNQIRRLAKKGKNTDEIAALVPSTVPRASITAIIAVSRRALKASA